MDVGNMVGLEITMKICSRSVGERNTAPTFLSTLKNSTVQTKDGFDESTRLERRHVPRLLGLRIPVSFWAFPHYHPCFVQLLAEAVGSECAVGVWDHAGEQEARKRRVGTWTRQPWEPA